MGVDDKKMFREGYQRNSKWNVERLIKKEVEFPGLIKKNLCGVSRHGGQWFFKKNSTAFQGVFMDFL